MLARFYKSINDSGGSNKHISFSGFLVINIYYLLYIIFYLMSNFLGMFYNESSLNYVSINQQSSGSIQKTFTSSFFCTGKHSIPRVVEEIILVSGEGRITKVPRIKYFEISYRPMEKPYYTTSNIHCRYITRVSTKLIIKTHNMYIVFARVRFYFISTILDSMDNKSDNSC